MEKRNYIFHTKKKKKPEKKKNLKKKNLKKKKNSKVVKVWVFQAESPRLILNGSVFFSFTISRSIGRNSSREFLNAYVIESK